MNETTAIIAFWLVSIIVIGIFGYLIGHRDSQVFHIYADQASAERAFNMTINGRGKGNGSKEKESGGLHGGERRGMVVEPGLAGSPVHQCVPERSVETNEACDSGAGTQGKASGDGEQGNLGASSFAETLRRHARQVGMDC